jgi:hypothetical protein
VPLAKLRDESVVPVLALLSPLGVVALPWVAARLSGPGIESISLMLRIGSVALGLAVGLSATAFWRARNREDHILSGIGLVGNAVLLLGGVVYASLR